VNQQDDAPGRDGTSAPSQAATILAALGGVTNIVEIEPCTTRLRSEVRDPAQVDTKALRAAGAHGVMITTAPPGPAPSSYSEERRA